MRVVAECVKCGIKLVTAHWVATSNFIQGGGREHYDSVRTALCQLNDQLWSPLFTDLERGAAYVTNQMASHPIFRSTTKYMTQRLKLHRSAAGASLCTVLQWLRVQD
jgi:hypothetical protein